MRKDSTEALLLRHYGNAAPTPAGLQGRLLASVRQEAAESHQEQLVQAQLRQKRISRRHAFRLIARETTRVGFDALNAGLDSLQFVESALTM